MTYKHACMTGVLALSLLAVSSCSDDDKWGAVDNAQPTFAVTSDHIMTEFGRDVHFAGKITDADGISKITLSNAELGLDKTIDLIAIYGEPQTEYDLDYKFRMRKELSGDNFNVLLTVYDVVGNKTEQTVLVTMDGDFTAPVFELAPGKNISVLMADDVKYSLKFTVRDNRVIDYVTIDVEGLEGFPKTIQGEGKDRIEYNEPLDLPAEEAEYKVTIAAYDKAAQEGEVRSTVIESLLSVAELADWEEFFLSDVKTPEELNQDVYGVPMRMDHVGEFRYRVRYYNKTAGTQIRFLPQQTDFEPICFAPSTDDAGVLGNSVDTTTPIVLDQAGVYYVFEVNTLEGTYSYKSYPVSEALSPITHMHLNGNDMNTWWDFNVPDPWWQELAIGPMPGNPSDNFPHFEQDSDNPNLLIIDNWKLEAGNQNFCIHNWHSHGWWDFYSWKADNDMDPSKCVFYGNETPDFPGKFQGNADFLTWKYTQALTPEEYEFMYPDAGEFSLTKWGSTDWRNKVTFGNWVKAAIAEEGTYRLELDIHSEHIKLFKK